ncbi:hypothetical protein PspLS_07783 [Pyricularia sp. CBS 133598]|nr:hypothetical protein PspLS_07783 [Pyricularia sp. CBS 133598]
MNQAPDGRWIRVPSAPTSPAQTSHRNAIRWPEQLQTAHHLDASHQLPGAHYQQQPQRPAIPHDHPPYPPRPPPQQQQQQQQQADQSSLGFERTYEVSSEYTVSPSPPSSAHRFHQHTAAPLPPRSPQPQPQQRDDTRKMSFESVLQLPPRRTNARASQACNTCRRLKTKCDMARPCKTCRDRKGDCIYSGSVSKYHDRYSQLLFDGLQHEMAKLQERTEHIERLLGIMTAPALDRALTNSTVTHGEALAIREQWHPQAARIDPGMQAALVPDMVGRPFGKAPAKIDTRPPVGPNDEAIMINHPTLAQEILQWPAVSQFVQRLLASEGIQSPADFPLPQEQQRDRLCPSFGAGESYEKTDKPTITHYELDPTGPSGPPLPNRIDWGQASGPPGHMSPERAGSGPQGSAEPDMSPETVWSLVQSYKNNIQNMHPLMGQEELEIMVNKFLESQSNPAKKQSAAAAKLTVRRLNKRKRSPICNGQDLSASENSDSHPPRHAQKLTRSDVTIEDAVILCILALGKISSHKERLSDSFSEDLHSWQHRLSPARPEQYPAPVSQSYPLPATLHADQHTTTNPRKYIHDMPGLEYLIQATDIMTSQMHGCTLKHVQASILAGLYYGQLGRALESLEQVQQAAMKIQQLIRPYLYRLQYMGICEVKDNQLIFAFWTCLQLESEMLDQLRLPRSGILLYEHVMPKPNAVKALQTGVEQDVMEHYMAQLYLRRQLNHIHDMLQPSCDPEHVLHRQPMSPTTPLIRAFKQCLDKSEWASERLQFDDNDAPSPNLLQARLRAKYWKALVATFRPVIRAIVNMPYEMPMYKVEEKENVGGEANLDDRIDASLYPLDPMMLEHARQAVKALVESTRAFHAIQDARLVIPDVFGTAHMQWSNLITLVAIYRDPRIGRLVDGVTLRDLFRRTIEFLGVVVHAPSSLSVILRILQRLEMELFDGRTDRIP